MNAADLFMAVSAGAGLAWLLLLWAAYRAVKGSDPPPRPTTSMGLPILSYEEDDTLDPTRVAKKKSKKIPDAAKKIVFDDEADQPVAAAGSPLFSVTAKGKTDPGRRQQNQDEILVMEKELLFLVADGVGGNRGGALASKLAALTMERLYRSGSFEGPELEDLPQHAADLARAIQTTNKEVFTRASEEAALAGMATTLCAAKFEPGEGRLYVGHVGDSRLYRHRAGALTQVTTDHVIAGKDRHTEEEGHLSRALGNSDAVTVDVLLLEPEPGDLYLLCTDGLTKMVDDAKIAEALVEDGAVDKLVAAAEAAGAKDNISVVVVKIGRP
jgi:protein phosphatase